MNIQAAIAELISGQSLSRADMESVMLTVMQGEATEAQIGGLLIGLRIKGETIDEIVGAASVMRSLATPVSIDTTGSSILLEPVAVARIYSMFQQRLRLSWRLRVAALPSTVTVHQALRVRQTFSRHSALI